MLLRLLLLRVRQGLKLAPFKRASVRPLSRPLPDWSTWKTPDVEGARLRGAGRVLCAGEPHGALAGVEERPTGICFASLSGTNFRPLSPGTVAAAFAWPWAPLARALPAGTLTKTAPFTGSTFTRLARHRRRRHAASTVKARCAAVAPNVPAGLGSTLPAASIGAYLEGVRARGQRRGGERRGARRKKGCCRCCTGRSSRARSS